MARLPPWDTPSDSEGNTMPEADTTDQQQQEQASQPAPADQAPPEHGQGRDADDQPLGEPGLKALRKERERGDRLEAQLNSLQPIREQFDALRSVFGDTGGDQSPEDVVKGLQQQVTQMQHDNLVNNVARQHGITDEDDVALLRDARDQDQMARLAARLKATGKPVAPTPDPGQGARPGATSQEDADYQQFYPTR